jgi:hypothetical protein
MIRIYFGIYRYGIKHEEFCMRWDLLQIFEHSLSSKELAMKDESFCTSRWSWWLSHWLSAWRRLQLTEMMNLVVSGVLCILKVR